MSDAVLSSAEKHTSTMNNLIGINRREVLREVLEWVERNTDPSRPPAWHILTIGDVKDKLNEMIKEA